MRAKNRTFPLRWLLFAVLVTALGSSVTLSRYMTTVSGAATAQVASVALGKVELKLDTNQIAVTKPGKSAKYTFIVTNENADGTVSDVALNYQITADSLGPLPLLLSLDSDSGALSAGEADEKTHTLTVSWPSEKNSLEYANMVNLITVTVTATQADPAAN